MSYSDLYGPELNLADFQKISTFIYSYYGIRLGPEKRIMVQSRLQSRLKALNIENFSEYVTFVFNSVNKNPELTQMIDRLTTNKTDFFREPVHFDFLRQIIMPEFRETEPSRPMLVWSAACSSGEEPYTIAMVIQDYANQHPGFRYSVLGTDLSTKILVEAKAAVYNEQKIDAIPIEYRKKFLLKSIDREKRLVRIVPEIRVNVSFDTANLLDDSIKRFGTFDLIFCRNVLIYFDRDTQLKVVGNLCQQIHSGGYLLTGHSEALTNFDLPLEQIKPAVYKKL